MYRCHFVFLQGLTRNLLFASFIIYFGSSFLFGYNIGVLNQPVEVGSLFKTDFVDDTSCELYDIIICYGHICHIQGLYDKLDCGKTFVSRKSLSRLRR